MAVSREIEENAMIRYFKTDNQRIHEEEKIGDGVWVQMLQPTHQECAEIAEVLNVDIEDIQAALSVQNYTMVIHCSYSTSQPLRYVMKNRVIRQSR